MKLTASDIRIGNWVIGYNDEPFQWDAECFYITQSVDVNELIKSPIPLTESILQMCGFEKKDNGHPTDFAEWYEKEFPVIGVLAQSSDKTYLFDENTDTLRIYYLHQLQNLYYSLTGNELEVEL